MVELIYCAAKNIQFAEIAIEAGFTYGARLPARVYFAPEFVDNEYKKPDFETYLKAIQEHQPRLATVIDWMRPEQRKEVLAWAEAIAPYVEIILVIPKVIGSVSSIPRVIGGTSVRLAYSVPTSYGGTPIPYNEFTDWPVHILGGSPQKARRLTRFLNVVSVDGNMHMKMATQKNAFFDPQKSTPTGYWPTLNEFDGQPWGDGSKSADAPYEAFRRSCENIMAMWTSKHDRPLW
jgi:hypothetical protein